jgi:hypothetical protein
MSAEKSGTTTYRVWDAVKHRKYGLGVVVAVEEGRVVVSFGGAEKTLVPELAPLTKADEVTARRNIVGALPGGAA